MAVIIKRVNCVNFTPVASWAPSLNVIIIIIIIIGRSRKIEPPNKAKIFAKLVMESQTNAALRYLSDNDSKGVLPLSDDVMEQLQEKHPEPHEARLGSLLFGPIEDIPDCLYQQIDREMIRDAALYYYHYYYYYYICVIKCGPCGP